MLPETSSPPSTAAIDRGPWRKASLADSRGADELDPGVGYAVPATGRTAYRVCCASRPIAKRMSESMVFCMCASVWLLRNYRGPDRYGDCAR